VSDCEELVGGVIQEEMGRLYSVEKAFTTELVYYIKDLNT